MLKSWEGYGKNWKHFVYKTDNLFRSTRVSHENSSVTKGFNFLELIWTPGFAVFKMPHSKPHNRFSTLSDFICYFSCIHSYFWAKWPWKLRSTTSDLWKGWKLAWYNHFTHIACAKKLRGLRQKLDTKQKISLEVSGFRTKTHLLQRDFIILNLS